VGNQSSVSVTYTPPTMRDTMLYKNAEITDRPEISTTLVTDTSRLADITFL